MVLCLGQILISIGPRELFARWLFVTVRPSALTSQLVDVNDLHTVSPVLLVTERGYVVSTDLRNWNVDLAILMVNYPWIGGFWLLSHGTWLCWFDWSSYQERGFGDLNSYLAIIRWISTPRNVFCGLISY